jgi:hypothetical protein
MRQVVTRLVLAGVALLAVASASAQVGASGSPTTTFERWQRVELPGSDRVRLVEDITRRGSGFIAVGGGTDVSPLLVTRVWTSNTGRAWRSSPVRGFAKRGVMRAIAKKDEGYVAVGQGRCPLPCAAAWHSPDGETWHRVAHGPAFAQSVMYDVLRFDGRHYAFGCYTPAFHCLAGRIWSSDDGGQNWEVEGDVPGIMFRAVFVVGGELVAGGDTTGFDDQHGTIATSPDAETWSFQGETDEIGRLLGAARRDGQALVGGFELSGVANRPRALLLDGTAAAGFDEIESPAFGGGLFLGVAVSGDRVLLGGSHRYRGIRIPSTLWTDDLQTFTRIRFPKASRSDFGHVTAVGVSRDGTRLVAGGRAGDDGAMWFTRATGD